MHGIYAHKLILKFLSGKEQTNKRKQLFDFLKIESLKIMILIHTMTVERTQGQTPASKSECSTTGMG